MAKRRELWANLVAPQFGGPVFPMSFSLTMSGAADLYMFVATRDMKVRRASVAHETAPSGTGLYTLYNLTTATDISSADIDADALAVDTAAAFGISSTAADVSEGDIVVLQVAGTGGGAITCTVEVEFLELKND